MNSENNKKPGADGEDVLGHLEKQAILKMDLKIKKSQLKDLRSQFTVLQYDNKQLQFLVNDITRDNTELERNITVALDSKKFLEGKYRDVCETKAKIVRQVDSLAAENKALKTHLTIAETAQSELQRELDDCKSRLQYGTMCKEDLTEKHTKTKSFLTTIQQQMKLLDTEMKALSLDNVAFQVLKKDLMTVEFYKKEFDRVTEENNKLQADIIFYKAKTHQMEMLMAHFRVVQPNDETEFFFKEWKKALKAASEQSESQKAIIDMLTEKVKKDSELTYNYIHREEEYLKEIRALKSTLKQYNPGEIEECQCEDQGAGDVDIVETVSEPGTDKTSEDFVFVDANGDEPKK